VLPTDAPAGIGLLVGMLSSLLHPRSANAHVTIVGRKTRRTTIEASYSETASRGT